MSWDVYLVALAAILAVSTAAWAVSVAIRNVAFVDSLWSLFFLIAAVIFAVHAGLPSARSMLVTVLVAVWALRLSVHITIRNWGKPEDYRYQAIRARNEPGFAFKSLYIVFGLQGVLAWFIALPLLPAIMVSGGIGVLEIVALGIWIIGFAFESVGDLQLARFKREASNQGKVLDSGLWRYTRHPNYFGDAAVWWGFFLIALATPGSVWTVFSPVLMTFFLLKVSGVVMLEKKLVETRPEYADYVARTSAFFPWFPRKRPAVTLRAGSGENS